MSAGAFRTGAQPAGKINQGCARRIGSSRCQAPILASQERSAALGYDTQAWFERIAGGGMFPSRHST
jgi:hypothetical protein